MGKDSTRDSAFRDTLATASDLAKQRLRLEELKSLDAQIDQLEKRKGGLEVESIAAEAALGAVPARFGEPITQDHLTDLAVALHELRRIEAQLKADESSKSPTASVTKSKGRLQAGREALISWLDASRPQQPSRGFKIAYVMLFVSTLIVIWGAIALHPVLLLALLGIGTMLAFLRSSEQNTAWLRLGAKRRYAATALAPPLEWVESAVRQRLTELNNQLSKADKVTADHQVSRTEVSLDQHEKLADALVEASLKRDISLGKIGVELSELDSHTQQWLEHLATAQLSKQELTQLNSLLRSANKKRNAAQEAVFSFLSHHGEAPEHGAADTKSLNRGLDRVAKRLR